MKKMWQDMCMQDLIAHLYMKEFSQIVAYFAIRTETVLQRLSVQIDPKIRSEFDGDLRSGELRKVPNEGEA